MAKTYTGDKTGSSFIINVNKPVDVRTVVDSVADLTNGSIPYPYAGLVVNIKGTGDLYVLTTGGRGASNINNWKKVGEGGEIDPEDYLSYYQEKLGAVILDSVSGLSSIESPFIGQFAYVKDDSETSEDESGLYLYDGGLWLRILTGSGEVSSDYVKREELEDYLKKEVLDDLAKKSDLDGYVRVEEAFEFLTESDLDIYVKKEDLPKNVSEFNNDAGYLTEHQDLSNYAEKDYVDVVIGSLDIPEQSEVLTTDGTIPTSGSGISISTDGDGSFVEEIYADDYLHAGVYYTSKGINSSKDNGGSELEGIGYITLSNGDSWIKFDNKSTITIYVRDDSLGFNAENIVGIIDSNGNEIKNPYAGYPYTESPISVSLEGKTYIKFNKDIYFTGLTETRDGDSTEYIFGQTGSNYEDLDFYTTNILPTVYAYSDNTPVRVLTEGDKEELLNKIDEAEPETISNEDIMDLF